MRRTPSIQGQPWPPLLGFLACVSELGPKPDKPALVQVIWERDQDAKPKGWKNEACFKHLCTLDPAAHAKPINADDGDKEGDGEEGTGKGKKKTPSRIPHWKRRLLARVLYAIVQDKQSFLKRDCRLTRREIDGADKLAY